MPSFIMMPICGLNGIWSIFVVAVAGVVVGGGVRVKKLCQYANSRYVYIFFAWIKVSGDHHSDHII